MLWTEALEVVVRETGVERYRTLCSDSSPHPDKVAYYRRLMIEKASEAKDVRSYPPVAAMAVNAAQSLLTAARDGCRVVDAEERERRLELCRSCEKYDAAQGRCRACGCALNLKSRIASAHCPLKLW